MPSPVALAYVAAIEQIERSPVAVEPEAQLTRPVALLLESSAAALDMGTLVLQREAQLLGVRPDFAALIDGRPCGWIELKARGHSLVGDSWRGRERAQWQQLRELDSLIVCNGDALRLYRLGEQIGEEVALPTDRGQTWEPEALFPALSLFLAARPPAVRRVADLAARLAPLARLLRERLSAGLAPGTQRAAVEQARAVWVANVHEGAQDSEFASDLAQVVAYSLAIAALTGNADRNGDGQISLLEARDSLRSSNAVLAASLGPVLEIPGLAQELSAEIGAIERLVSSLDPTVVAASDDPRGEPWLWFYEDFLAVYDPAARERAGVYYTPTAVVQLQVRQLSEILKGPFARRLGFADRAVVTLDPATGSGTYPLAVVDDAQTTAIEVRGPAGPRQISRHLTENLLAFELLPGPYAVAHLRIGRRLAELDHALVPPGNVRVYLTNTLDDPESSPRPLTLWGDVQVLAEERERARTVKQDQPVTVILGNPPYERGTRVDGHWVVNPAHGRALFDDVLEPAQRAGVIFSAQASLYNQYVYFWRWAFWKAFEQDTTRSAAVSFITAASWLDTPVFIGLRELALRHADQIWITHLGGEGRGNNAEDNVFNIQTPVAVVTLFRRNSGARGTRVYYRRIVGTRAEKLASLADVRSPLEAPESWTMHEPTPSDSMIPRNVRAEWSQYPLLSDVMPWRQPGLMINRSWPVSPDPSVLESRWAQLIEDPSAATREQRFNTGKHGRNIYVRVGGMTPIAEVPVGTPPRRIERYSYRAFDREWILNDPRVINLERPELWATLSDQQIYLSTMNTSPLGHGPAVIAATTPPDKHHFRGSFGGRDVHPLYLDRAAHSHNLDPKVLRALGDAYGSDVVPDDFVAYLYAVMSTPGYFATFERDLEEAGPRVPLTSDRSLFHEGVALGRRLLFAHTFGRRFGSGMRPVTSGAAWQSSVTRMPDDDIRYDPTTGELSVADGIVSGVSEGVWGYSVSGWPVLRRWLENRSLRGRGKARSKPSELDLIRSTEWLDDWNDELIELVDLLSESIALRPQQDDLLARVIQGPAPTITA